MIKKKRVDEAELKKVKQLIAAKIQAALDFKGLSRTQFAAMVNRPCSMITKWLSGNHNFTMQTLWDIEWVLEIQLINLMK